MDYSEARLDTIESQRSMVVSGDQRKRRYFPMSLLNKGKPPSMGDTESVPEFLTNLNFSDLFDLPGEYVPMSPEIFSVVSTGNKEFLEKLRINGTHMACLKSDRGDSILHLVAAWGHLEAVKTIVSECPCLLAEPNSKDQLPLHVAAHGGHLAVVEALVAAVTFVSAKLSEEQRERLNLLVRKDRDGDTPLHAAMKGRQMDSASCLVNANQQASFLADKNGISPLYMAVEVGNVSLVKAMLKKTTANDGFEGSNSTLNFKLEGRKFLVHAALKAMNIEILDIILKEDPSFEDERDEEGRTCLSFGASIGFHKGVCSLLDRSTKSVYVCDDDGSFPIHIAAKKGQIRIVKELLKRCPDSKHLLNRVGQNILHIAANGGKLLLVYYLVRRDATKHLVQEQDVDGNTPLHLATIKWRPRVIFLLFRSREKSMYTRNNSGLTALDIAESLVQPNYIFMERMTLLVIVFSYTRRDPTSRWTKKLTKPSNPIDRDNNKEYTNALLLVATLVATVTFAAGFTIPGGFNSSPPHLGRATLVHDSNLIWFLVFDTLAMQSSVIAIATLIWAQLGDPALVHRCLRVALPLLFLALLCMPLAFCSGVAIAVGHAKGLINFLRFTFTIFLYGMIFILGPHVILQIPDIPAYFGIYFLQFLMFVYEDGDEVHQTLSHTFVDISGKDHARKPVST